MKRGAVAIVVTLGLASAVMPALAANDDVTLEARDFSFEPNEVTIEVGDTVTFTIDPESGSFHNFCSSTRRAGVPGVPVCRRQPCLGRTSRGRSPRPARTTFVCRLHAIHDRRHQRRGGDSHPDANANALADTHANADPHAHTDPHANATPTARQRHADPDADSDARPELEHAATQTTGQGTSDLPHGGAAARGPDAPRRGRLVLHQARQRLLEARREGADRPLTARPRSRAR